MTEVKKWVCLYLLFNMKSFAISQFMTQWDNGLPEDGRLDFVGLANKYGFKCEEHEVITPDGYVLKVFRIPRQVRRQNVLSNDVILLTHGCGGTSDDWILRGNTSLAITLAKNAYDVWVLNVRGNRYSRKNVNIDPDKEPEKFFNYSFYEMGIYDGPSTIDYILEITGHTQVTVIGHSQGTAMYFAMGAEKPDYNAKVKLFIALAPVAIVTNTTNKFFSSIKKYETKIMEVDNFNKNSRAKQAFCLYSARSSYLCRNRLFLLYGPDEDGLELEFFPTLLGHFPGGTSSKAIVHLSQLNHYFSKFDYGKKRNLEYYQSEHPPAFNLTKVTMKTALIVGQNDYLVPEEDARRLRYMLPNIVKYILLPYKKFNHIDFIIGSHMTNSLFPYIFDLLK